MVDKLTDQFFADVFKPGGVILTSGFRGGGKSHTAVAVAEELVRGVYPSVGKVVVLSNIIFFHKVNGQIVEEPPEDVHHITTMKEVFPIVVDAIERYGREVTILLILDEAQNFIGGDSNQTNASVMMKEFLGIIRKFRMCVWFLCPSARSIGPAFRNFLNDPKYPGNLTCKFMKDLGFNARYIESHKLNLDPKELMLVKATNTKTRLLRVPVTEWTGTIDTLLEGGYCYDHEASATFYVGEGFDWELFNRTVGGVSSVNILDTIKRYYAEHGDAMEAASRAEPVKVEKVKKQTVAEIAVGMLNKGMTERDVAEKLGMSRDSMRWKIKSAGYVKVRRATDSDSEKVWVLPDPNLHPKSEVASTLGGWVEGGQKNIPIYISKGAAVEPPFSGCPTPKSPDGPEPSSKSLNHDGSKQSPSKADTSTHDDSRHGGEKIPDGTYSMEELRQAVRWCIGDEGGMST